MKKCYNCRTEIEGDKLFCKDCKGAKPTSGTYIIYDKI